jgi:hypothetical protein
MYTYIDKYIKESLSDLKKQKKVMAGIISRKPNKFYI